MKRFLRNQNLFQAAKELGVTHSAIRLWFKRAQERDEEPL